MSAGGVFVRPGCRKVGARPSQGSARTTSPMVPQARPVVVINSNETLLVRKETQLASHFELENQLEMGDVKLHEPSLISGQE